MFNAATDVIVKCSFTKIIGIKFCPWPSKLGYKAPYVYPMAESGLRYRYMSNDIMVDTIFYEIKGNSTLFMGLSSFPIRRS